MHRTDAQWFEDHPTFAFRFGIDGRVDVIEASFRRYHFFSPRIDVALSPVVHSRFGLSEEEKKRIREAERTFYSKASFGAGEHKKVDIEKMLKRQALGSELELAIVDCLSEQQLRECAAIYNCYLFYDSGPAHWVKVFGASDSEVEEVKVSASHVAESLRKELLSIEKEATSKLLSCLSPNVAAEIEKLLYPNAVTVHPTPTLFYDSLTNQRQLGVENIRGKIPARKLSVLCSFEATDMFSYKNRYAIEFEEFLQSCGSLPEFSDAQAKELTVIYQILFDNKRREKEEELLLWRTEFEKGLKILTPAQQSEFSRRQMMGRIRREGLIPSLAAAPANLGPLLKLDPRQVQKLNDSKEVACVYIKDRMLIAQQKYIELIFAGLPAVLRSKLKSKLEWESAITAKTVPPLEILLFHCEKYE